MDSGEQRFVLDRIEWLFDVAKRFDGKLFQPKKPLLGGSYLVCIILYQGRTLALLENPLTKNATYAIPEELVEASERIEQTWEDVAARNRKQDVRDKKLALRIVHVPTERTMDDMEYHDERVFESIDGVLAEIRGTEVPRDDRVTKTSKKTENDKQPKTPESSLDQYREIIASLPRVALDDPRLARYLDQGGTTGLDVNQAILSRLISSRPSNNFSVLFKQMRILEQNPDSEIFTLYVDRAQNYGEPWRQFVEQHRDLLDRMAPVLDMDNNFDSLVNYYSKLLRRDNTEGLRELEETIDHPLGLYAFGIAIDDKLIPLLEEAKIKMRALGIDPTRFY